MAAVTATWHSRKPGLGRLPLSKDPDSPAPSFVPTNQALKTKSDTKIIPPSGLGNPSLQHLSVLPRHISISQALYLHFSDCTRLELGTHPADTAATALLNSSLLILLAAGSTGRLHRSPCQAWRCSTCSFHPLQQTPEVRSAPPTAQAMCSASFVPASVLL